MMKKKPTIKSKGKTAPTDGKSYTNQQNIQDVSLSTDEIIQCNSGIENCVCLDTLVTVMKQYNHYSKDTQNIAFDTVPVRALNSYIHFLQRHINEFDFITNRLGLCNVDKCNMIKHNTLDNVYLQILDKMHRYFYHSYDIGHVLSARDKILIQKDQSVNIEKHVPTDHLFRDRIKLRYRQLSKDSTFIANKNKMYSFGYMFKYGEDDYYSENYDLMVEPKYKSLKEELLNNKMATLVHSQFNSEYMKAECHFNTAHCKWYHYGINIQQILALMVYCNFDILQCYFSRTYRENLGEQHKEFYHWGKCLKMAVHQHGTRIKNGNVRKFWHGISEKTLFPRYINDIRIAGPLSTTSSFMIASSFTNHNNGFVIQFNDTSGFNEHFSVSWLSDYACENEYLFIQNEYALKIQNIIDVETGVEYNIILQALRIIDNLMSDRHVVITEEMRHLTGKIISHQLSLLSTQFQPLESLTIYAKDMIQTYFERKNEIHINIQQLQKQHSLLKHLLFENQKNVIWILCTLFPSSTVIQIDQFNGSCIPLITASLDYFQKHNSKLRWIQIKLSNPLSDSEKEKIKSVWESEFGTNNRVKITTQQQRIFIGRHTGKTKMCINYPLPKYSKLSQYFSRNKVISNLILRTYIWNTKLMDIIECFIDNQITDSYFNNNQKQKFRDTLNELGPNILTEFIWHYMARDTIAGASVVKQLVEFEKLEPIEITELSDELSNVLVDGNQEKKHEDAIIKGESEIQVELEKETSNHFKQYSNRLISCHGDCGSKLSTLISNCTKNKKMHSFKEYSSTIGDAFWFNDSRIRVLLTKLMHGKGISQQNNYKTLYEELMDENCFINGDDWTRKITSLFINLCKDEHFDILQAIANASCNVKHRTLLEEINAFNEDNNETVLSNREVYKDRIQKIKQKKEYKLMKQYNLELSHWELSSIMLYCNGGLIAYEIRKSHQDDQNNSCQWKHLTTYLLSALHKIYAALHFQNEEFKKEYIDERHHSDNKLFHGLRDVSFANDNMEHLFMYTVTSFSENIEVAKGCSSSDGMIFSIDNAYELIYNGELKAANVSWISQWGKAEEEWIVCPTKFLSIIPIHTDNKIYKEYMEPRNPKIYEIGVKTLNMQSYKQSNKTKFTEDDILPHSDSGLQCNYNGSSGQINKLLCTNY